MSVFSRIADKARSFADRNPGKVRELTDKAARFADKRTHGRYRKQINEAVRKVDGFVRRDRGHGGRPPGR